MALPTEQIESLLERNFSRRQLGRIVSLVAAGATFPFYNEFTMAQQAERDMRGSNFQMGDPDVVRICSNENPQGPCKEGLEAIAKVAPYGWRYCPVGNPGGWRFDAPTYPLDELVKSLANELGVKPEYVSLFAGSSDPLLRSQCAFTSPARSWCMADPGYGGGAPAFIGSKLVCVPLRDDYSHDVEGMIKEDPNAGAYYICNPNNPSGTLTARKDIEYLLANKQKDSVVVVDEAYIHFSEGAQPSTELVAADKDILVLRTFSKIYAMAGLRVGAAVARPDLLERIRPYGTEYLPVTGIACALASLKVKHLVPERRAQMKQIREDTFEYLEKKGISFISSQTNFFMMDVKRPGAEFAQAMADQKIIIGRIWPAWPTKVRVTVGTKEEMAKFKVAVGRIMG